MKLCKYMILLTGTALLSLSVIPGILSRVFLQSNLSNPAPQETVRIFYYILSLSLMFLVLTIFIIHKRIFSRIARISRFLAGIETCRDLDKQLPARGSDELAKLESSINKMLETLRRSKTGEQLKFIGQFSTQMAHEIRNPLGAISLNIQMLSDRLVFPKEYQEVIGDIKIGIQRIQGILYSILGFARPLELTLKEGHVHSVLENSLFHVTSELNESGIQVVKNYQAETDRVRLDMDHLIKVFTHLFTNAADAMNPRGTLLIQTRSMDHTVEVEVRDTGKGILPGNLEKIFTPFFTTKTRGSGLGLALAHKILEQHQATISVESKVGEGTQFKIRFPLA